MTMKSLLNKLMLVSCGLAIAVSSSMAMDGDGDKKIVPHNNSEWSQQKSRNQDRLARLKQNKERAITRFSDNRMALRHNRDAADKAMDTYNQNMDQIEENTAALEKRCDAVYGKAMDLFYKFTLAVQKANTENTNKVYLPYDQALDILNVLEKKLDEQGDAKIQEMVEEMKVVFAGAEDLIEVSKDQAMRIGDVLKYFNFDECK